MEMLLLAFIIWGIGQGINQANVLRQEQLAQESREDEQDFTAVEAEKSRKWEEEMYLKYQSPEAMYNQFRGTGASENASIMAALGVSPSSMSGAIANNGAMSLPGIPGINSMADVFKALTEGELNKSKKTGQDIENQYAPRLNEARIEEIATNVSYLKNKIHLDNVKFYEVEKPMAMSLIDKNYQEIEESQQRVRESIQKIQNMEEEINLYKSQEAVNYENVQLMNSQEEVNRSQVGVNNAEMSKLGAEARGQEIENAIKQIERDLSEEMGWSVRLDWKNGLVYVGEGTRNVQKMAIDAFLNLYNKTCDSAKSMLQQEATEEEVFDKVERLYNEKTTPEYRRNHPNTMHNVRTRYKEYQH